MDLLVWNSISQAITMRYSLLFVSSSSFPSPSFVFSRSINSFSTLGRLCLSEWSSLCHIWYGVIDCSSSVQLTLSPHTEAMLEIPPPSPAVAVVAIDSEQILIEVFMIWS